MRAAEAAHRRLVAVLERYEALAIAVSGGVDSMTLAAVAHTHVPGAAMFHAVSAAVPPEATARVEAHAERHGWRLTLIEPGELSDPAYRSNPINRCFFCKDHLYRSVRAHTAERIASGTNRDDLGDFRPGLGAAAQHGVVHPFVEAEMDKASVRRLAASLGLRDLSELPASPCLASRIRTGLPIRAEELARVHRAELGLRARVDAENVRCRVTPTELVVQLDARALDATGPDERRRLRALVRDAFAGDPRPVRIAPYERGSAFVAPEETSRG